MPNYRRIQGFPLNFLPKRAALSCTFQLGQIFYKIPFPSLPKYAVNITI